MSSRAITLTLATLAMSSAPAATSTAHAQTSAPPLCAATVDDPTPSPTRAGEPCWTEVTPYPFGDDGEPVDPAAGRCRPLSEADTDARCHLTVTSMAFRAWNRGVAAMVNAPVGQSPTPVTYGMWLWNGRRWYPDPTFPGGSTCSGDTVFWAGKLDYWLVGPTLGGDWPRVCRYDGSTYTWQQFDLPDRTRDRVRVVPVGPPHAAPLPSRRAFGAIRTGSCFAWNDCWLFGNYGAVVHWDGTALRDVSPDPGARPWLGAGYTAAVSGRDFSGAPYGLAVGATFGGSDGSATSNFTLAKDPQDPNVPGPVPSARDATPAPQVFASSGSTFEPLDVSVPTISRPGDPHRTDLVAAAFNVQGRGWLAGLPTGLRLPGVGAGRRSGPSQGPEPAPLVPVTPQGRDASCTAPEPDRFRWPANPATGTGGYLWSSLAVVPGTGDAVAGGQVQPPGRGTWRNDDGLGEPVIVRAACDGSTSEVRFRVADRSWDDDGDAPLVPAARTGSISAVAVNAINDGWAASTQGGLGLEDPLSPGIAQRPRLYRLTDGQTPAALAGDDDEPRPLVFEPDPPIFVEAPPEPEPAASSDTTVTQLPQHVPRTKKLKPAVYRVRTKLSTAHGSLVLYVSFRVRRRITLGVEALRGGKVVSSSGLQRFKPTHGRLALRLDRKRWPTRIRFVNQTKRGSKSVVPMRLRFTERLLP